jgi:hypothetical protein
METHTTDIWTYRDRARIDGAGQEIIGYSVEATDGSIGKVDAATYEIGSSYFVVDTGPWIFGHKVMLPAGVIDSIDDEQETVFVNRTKSEIKDSPELQEGAHADDEYRERLGSYYTGSDR